MNYNRLKDATTKTTGDKRYVNYNYYKRDTKYVKSLPINGTFMPDYCTVPISAKLM